MTKKILINEKSFNAIRILSHLNDKKLSLKKLVDSKVDSLIRNPRPKI